MNHQINKVKGVEEGREYLEQTSSRIWGLAAVLISILFVASGLVGWPGLHWDSVAYTSPILNIATGQGWLYSPFHFGLRPQEIIWLSVAKRPFDSHGMLPTIIFGEILKVTTYRNLLAWYGLINALTFLSYRGLMARISRGRFRFAGASSLLFGVMAGMIAMNTQGRPEQLVPIIVSGYLWFAMKDRNKKGLLAAACLTTGLIFITSPLPGALFGLGYLVISGIVEKKIDMQFWARMIGYAIGSLAISAIILDSLTPYELLGWIKRTSSLMEGNAYRFTRYLFNPYNSEGISTYSPLWNLMVLSLVGTGVLLLAIRRRYVVLVIALPLIVILVPKGVDYSYIVFFPAIAVLIMKSHDWCAEEFKRMDSIRHGITYLIGVLGVMACLYGIGLILATAEGFLAFKRGAFLEDAEKRLEDTIGQFESSDKIRIGYPALSYPAFAALRKGNTREMIATTVPSLNATTNLHPIEIMQKRLGKSLDYFIVPQGFVDNVRAPKVVFLGQQSFKLIDGFKISHSRQVVGPSLTGFWYPYRTDYSYALYRRDARDNHIK